MITSRGEPGGGPLSSASRARGAGGGRNAELLLEKMTASVFVRSANRAAKIWAIMPPIDAPTMWACLMSR